MQALVIDNGVHFDSGFARPVIKPGEALIKTVLAGICATDLELLHGYANFQGVPGHEFVGVVEVADNPSLIGQRVVGEINCPCKSCATCLRGDTNHCPNRLALGIRHKNGVFADYFTLPQANLHIVPAGISDRQAVFTEPLAAALEILEQVHIAPGDTVVVLGDGRLGILIAQVLALTGCDLVVVGRHPSKWGLLLNKSIKVCLAKDLEEGYLAKVVVECSGSSGGFTQARKLVQPKGYLVLKSTFNSDTLVDLSSLVVDEISVIGSRCGPFSTALRLLASGNVEVEEMIGGEFHLKNGVEAFKKAKEKGVVKILLKP
ncbi:MAG: alcohol dehydrogenase catalytic domain-containing protein [Magnetococcales bacterium]|nr:alcohol dehydrogenase catalytic domain-containing protein [Magnetococcales bacterium]